MAKKQRDALAWGIILIVIGFIFILENFDVEVWDFVARLWPLILIVWGAWKLYFGIKERKEVAAAPKQEQD
ncbi:MAG: DUF5668 domain-containing protein [Acidobacteriota bacterium]